MIQRAMPKEVPEIQAPIEKKTMKYTGPAKGTPEAKERMEKVRAAQWAKNGLTQSSQ